MSAPRAVPVFFYDLGSPECYLAAERIMAALPDGAGMGADP